VNALRCAPLFLLLAGCVKYPEPYRPPVQRFPQELAPVKGLGYFVSMTMPNALDYCVSEVVPELMDNSWRWTLQRPVFRFQAPAAKRLRLRADIAVAGVTFEQTGPVKILVYVENHLLDTIEFPKAAPVVFDKEVPAEWLTTERPVFVRLEIDKLWVSPSDGVKRGFILNSIGFVQ